MILLNSSQSQSNALRGYFLDSFRIFSNLIQFMINCLNTNLETALRAAFCRAQLEMRE